MALVFIFVGFMSLCTAGGNLLGQSPDKKLGVITGANRPVVPAAVLGLVSVSAFGLGLAFLYKSQEKPK
jgi:hypothetical protein